MPLTIEFARNLARLDEIGADWAALHAAAGGGPFSSHDWLAAWAASYGGAGVAPRIGLAWAGGRLVAAMPLGLRRRRLVPGGPRAGVLAMLADERAGFHEVLAVPGTAGLAGVRALLDACLAQQDWDLLDLTPLRGADAVEALVVQAQARGLAVWRRDEVRWAFSDLRGGWPAYLARRSPNFRKSIRSARNKVTDAGGRLRVIRGDEVDAAAGLDQALDLSARCWKAQMGTDIGSNPRIRGYMADIWARFAAGDAARLLLLCIGDRAVASFFMLRSGDRAFGLICDFDEGFAALSPGRHVVSHALELAAAEGAASFNMMRLTPFLERFADEVHSFERLRICRRFSLPWLWLSVADRVRPLARQLRKRYRQRHYKRIAFKDRAGTRGAADDDR